MPPDPPLCQLVRFDAADGAELSGLLYEPRRSTEQIVIFLHGTGGASIFDSRRTNLLAAEMVGRRIAWLPFNNRGAHLMRRLRVRGRKKGVAGGMAYELIRDSVHDIDGAVRFARRLGYRNVTLAGHSTGANKIAVYDHYKPRNRVRRYVLLAGGDDTGLMYEQLGAARFRSALRRARERRRSEELVPASISPQPMSWRSLYDMINPDGDYNVFPFLEAWGRAKLSRRPLFRHLRGIRKPALMVYGENDEYCFGDVPAAVGALAAAVGPRPNVEIAVMKDADHGFGGKEKELGTLIAEWIRG
ncbi:MAG TPA: alpha/beta hydrolase [Thermoanaerobaculia bacterium]|nr:alpha/beta hydrolase [Thermoanaerobaculia bacterium]